MAEEKKESPKTLRVRATEAGFYGDERRYPGEVFELVEKKGVKKHPITDKEEEHVFTVDEQFSERWMEKVDEDVPVQKVVKAPPGKPEQAVALSSAGKKAKKSTGDTDVL